MRKNAEEVEKNRISAKYEIEGQPLVVIGGDNRLTLPIKAFFTTYSLKKNY